MPKSIPQHLKHYTVKQDYSRYTPEDQAVWRYVMRRLKKHLSRYAHPCYVDGLKKTGIDSESIPRVSRIDRKLRRFGWGAVPVSGFIPPAAFMEFQALGYLPIATEIRTPDHVDYTPAPDIIHEAAGHAPIIVDKEYAAYLKKYAQLAAKSIISSQDMGLYEAIRLLSDAKENPNSSATEISKLEKDLEAKSKAITDVSEAGLLSRMNWWTAEYGLIGTLKDPRIFGAGLLSSPGEAVTCLSDKVKKIPLTVDCLRYSYDITERQPQLFVTSSFNHLSQVLDDLRKQLSFVRGGVFGLDCARRSGTVNTVQLDTGLQISGKVESDSMSFLKLSGPCQISINGKELKGHGTKYHQQGFSSPLGTIVNFKQNLTKSSPKELAKLGFKKNRNIELEFESGIRLSGRFLSVTRIAGFNVLLAFKDCLVVKDETVLFSPDWGTYDLALGETVTSVFGGPADRIKYGSTDEFVAKQVPKRKRSGREVRLYKIYATVRKLRVSKSKSAKTTKAVKALWSAFQAEFFDQWLLGLEIFELMTITGLAEDDRQECLSHLQSLPISSVAKSSLSDGLDLLNAI